MHKYEQGACGGAVSYYPPTVLKKLVCGSIRKWQAWKKDREKVEEIIQCEGLREFIYKKGNNEQSLVHWG